jgi:hypothetical protein
MDIILSGTVNLPPQKIACLTLSLADNYAWFAMALYVQKQLGGM